MYASVGDWLVVGTTGSRTRRRGKITAVGEHGAPPYVVHWLDEDREALVIPGPDALVLTPAQQADADSVTQRRVAAVQDEIVRHHSTVG